MDPTTIRRTADELEALRRERRRIEAQLREAASPRLEAMLRDEHRWVVRRQRALERVPVAARAALWFGGVARTCLVRDVSARGAGVDADVQPRVGETVRLVLGELDGAPQLEAVVRHVTGRRVGLEFTSAPETAWNVAELLARRFAVGDG